MTFTPEEKFCVRYLLNHGINSTNFTKVARQLKPDDEMFDIVKVKDNFGFFDELAEKLRELWPPGEKDGKYPWRDSVNNLSRRLKTLWNDRQLKDISIDDCLAVARRYLAQFEQNAKYMKILKYFILKQDKIILKDGRITYTNSSIFADMLEGKVEMDSSMDEEWNAILNGTIDEGEII